MTDSGIIVSTFIVYLVAVLGIGVVAWRRTNSLRDYILGGRGLGKWVTALSAQASDMSGWLLLGLPGYAYLAGLESAWLLIGLLVGTYLNWKFVAERLRQATERLGDALTLPDYFETRFADHSRILRLISGIFILVFFTFYTSSGLVAGGKLFETVFGLPYLWAVTAGGATVVIYTFFGGFLAVSWTDMMQGCLMFLALLTVAVVGLFAAGGLGGLGASLGATNPHLLDAMTTVSGAPLGWITIVSLLGWGLGYCGQPHILARFMAIRRPQDVGAARLIAMVWVSVALVAATLVGLVGIGLVPQPLHRGGKRDRVHGADPIAAASGGGGYLPCRHPGRRDEHGGFPVAGCLVRRIRGFLQGSLATRSQPEGTALGRAPRGRGNFPAGLSTWPGIRTARCWNWWLMPGPGLALPLARRSCCLCIGKA